MLHALAQLRAGRSDRAKCGYPEALDGQWFGGMMSERCAEVRCKGGGDGDRRGEGDCLSVDNKPSVVAGVLVGFWVFGRCNTGGERLTLALCLQVQV